MLILFNVLYPVEETEISIYDLPLLSTAWLPEMTNTCATSVVFICIFICFFGISAIFHDYIQPPFSSQNLTCVSIC